MRFYPICSTLFLLHSFVFLVNFAAQSEKSSAQQREGLISPERGVSVAPTKDFTKPEPFEAQQGGAGTQLSYFDQLAFSKPTSNLSSAEDGDFALGDAIFRRLWVSAPASVKSSDGLGPLFNARACQNCHLRDGRGHPPSEGQSSDSFIIGLSILDSKGKSLPEPRYGIQFQDAAISGVHAEGRVEVTYKEKEILLSGGETVSLRFPSYRLVDLTYGDMDPSLMISPRVAPQLIGLGLIEAIRDADILSAADPDDADGDGISGRVSQVEQPNFLGSKIGRFGLKASQAGIRGQSAVAFANDMGLGTSLVRKPHGDCTSAQKSCLQSPIGAEAGEYEVPDLLLDLVELYSRSLAVPGRRQLDDPEVLRGKEIFYNAGCISCHRPKYITSDNPLISNAFRKQLIWPYTDLLLHDMGEDLADGRPDGTATGREWRTPPLWGIGLTKSVSGHTLFLHDGRARNLLEAVIWHGGEAAEARDKVISLDPEDRAALLRFLESL